MERLVKNGADVDAKDNDGETPLSVAIIMRRTRGCGAAESAWGKE
jgi:ankyrin repeat protein